MSNEYNYYNPNPEDFDHNNIFDEQPKQEKPKKPKKKWNSTLNEVWIIF